jgi:hypothetical protein
MDRTDKAGSIVQRQQPPRFVYLAAGCLTLAFMLLPVSVALLRITSRWPQVEWCLLAFPPLMFIRRFPGRGTRSQPDDR